MLINESTCKNNPVYGLSILTDTTQGVLVVVFITALMGNV